MRRPSIYNPRVSRVNKAAQSQAQKPLEDRTPSHAVNPPKGILNAESKAGKRKRNDDVPTQRMTRAKVCEAAKSKQLATPINTRETTTTEEQPVIRDQGKRKLVVVLQAQTQTQGQSIVHETKPSKSAPRRPGGPSCKQCRQQHQGCDRGRPACGRCTKARAGACEYPDTQSAATQPAVRPSNTQKKSAPQQDRRPGKLHAHRETATKLGEPTKVKTSVTRPNLRNPANKNSSIKSDRAPRSRKPPKILTDATDLETFLKM
jgi:hypothetical protein